jgi:ribosomal protein S26
VDKRLQRLPSSPIHCKYCGKVVPQDLAIVAKTGSLRTVCRPRCTEANRRWHRKRSSEEAKAARRARLMARAVVASLVEVRCKHCGKVVPQDPEALVRNRLVGTVCRPCCTEAYRYWNRKRSSAEAKAARRARSIARAEMALQDVVRCKHCGKVVPQDPAALAKNRLVRTVCRPRCIEAVRHCRRKALSEEVKAARKARSMARAEMALQDVVRCKHCGKVVPQHPNVKSNQSLLRTRCQPRCNESRSQKKRR